MTTGGCLHPWLSVRAIRNPLVLVILDRQLPTNCQAYRSEEEKGIPTECADDDVNVALGVADRLARYCYSVQIHGEATCSLWFHEGGLDLGLQMLLLLLPGLLYMRFNCLSFDTLSVSKMLP